MISWQTKRTARILVRRITTVPIFSKLLETPVPWSFAARMRPLKRLSATRLASIGKVDGGLLWSLRLQTSELFDSYSYTEFCCASRTLVLMLYPDRLSG